MSQEDMEVVKDGRGFQKTENFQVMNPNEANFQTNGMSFHISPIQSKMNMYPTQSASFLVFHDNRVIKTNYSRVSNKSTTAW